MTELEKQIWTSTYAAIYVREIDLGFRRGEQPDPDNCDHYSVTAMDIADSAVLATRRTKEESEFIGLLVT